MKKAKKWLLTFSQSRCIKAKSPTGLHNCFKSTGMLRCSPGYGAPEIVTMQDSCDKAVDMWSIGVSLYLMLTQRQPFVGNTGDETRRKMMSGKYDCAPLAHCR